MSKLLNIYKSLKEKDENTFYLFKSGIFYIFLDEDAIKINKLLGLKITNLNEEIVKCGFPISSYSKYFNILNIQNIKYQIIDNVNNQSLNFNEVTIDKSLKKLVLKINKLNTESLSISEAYDFIEEIKQDAKNINIGEQK